MNTKLTVLMLASLLSLISACGQKGPLIIEQDEAIQQQEAQQGTAADKKWDTNEQSVQTQK